MAQRRDINKVLIIGSGPTIIGQACEFDYSGTQACKALRENGYEVVLTNSNPATIMTDPGMADHTYIEPLTVDSLEKIINKERPDALLPNLGGQTALNLAISLQKEGILEKYGVEVIGVDLDAIERGEDRIEFTGDFLFWRYPQDGTVGLLLGNLENGIMGDSKFPLHGRVTVGGKPEILRLIGPGRSRPSENAVIMMTAGHGFSVTEILVEPSAGGDMQSV